MVRFFSVRDMARIFSVPKKNWGGLLGPKNSGPAVIFGHPGMPLRTTFFLVVLLVVATLLKNFKNDNKKDNWCYN